VPGRDDDGAVRVYVGPGNYKATVSSRGYVTAAVDFTVPGPEVRVALSSGGVLLLTAEKTTRVRLMGGARPMNSYVSPQGTRLEGIAPGTYTLEVFADDGKTVVKTLPVSMAAGQTVSMRVD
jgi:hypothetical protein